MAYAREVYDYNAIVIKGAFRPNLVQKFAKVAKSFEDPKINEIWEIMKYMVDVTAVSRNRDPMQSRQQVAQFVEQAKKYLENRYKVYMTTIISGNLREAQRGGVPSIFNLVSSFVGLTFNQGNCFGLQDVTIDGKPLWKKINSKLEASLSCTIVIRLKILQIPIKIRFIALLLAVILMNNI